MDSPIGNNALIQFMDEFLNLFAHQFVSGVDRPSRVSFLHFPEQAASHLLSINALQSVWPARPIAFTSAMQCVDALSVAFTEIYTLTLRIKRSMGFIRICFCFVLLSDAKSAGVESYSYVKNRDGKRFWEMFQKCPIALGPLKGIHTGDGLELVPN